MSETLFTTQTPTGNDNTDGSPGITFGTTVQFAVPGQITHVRFFSTLSALGNYQGAVWRVDAGDPNAFGGTLLATSPVVVGETDLISAAWNPLALTVPADVETDTLYRVGVFSAAGRYVNTPHFFDTFLANGNITAEAAGADPVGLGALSQGTFAINPELSYPYQSFNANSYFVDPVFVASGGPAPDHAGSAAFLLDLAAAAAGSRESAGTAPLVIDLAPAATGARTSAGLAALALDLHAAPAGNRPSAGSAALGLGLALGASGGRLARSDQPRILSAETSDRIESAFRPLRWEV